MKLRPTGANEPVLRPVRQRLGEGAKGLAEGDGKGEIARKRASYTGTPIDLLGREVDCQKLHDSGLSGIMHL
jgi:hypothetical protein